MLRDSYGLTGRRLGVQANTDLNALPFYPLANWSRGSASGGGLYPVSIHWVSGPNAPVPPGVHYYSTRHHAMQRLLTGDVSGQVREALGAGAPGPGTDQYLVLGIKYWQNSFKYNSFSFHAVSMDLGACVQTWRMWAAARGLAVEPALWFDEERLAALLGVDPAREGIFAVVPLKWAGEQAGSGRPAATADVSVRRADVERSRTVLTFDALLRMQAATSADATTRPAPEALGSAAAHPVDPGLTEVALPPARPLDADVRTALRARRSSFGRFDAQKPLTADQLSACLAAASAGSRLGGDTGDVRLAQLYAFVSHVEGVEPGSYVYDPGRRSLRRVKEGRPGSSSSGTTSSPTTTWSRPGPSSCRPSAPPPSSTPSATGDTGWSTPPSEPSPSPSTPPPRPWSSAAGSPSASTTSPTSRSWDSKGRARRPC